MIESAGISLEEIKRDPQMAVDVAEFCHQEAMDSATEDNQFRKLKQNRDILPPRERVHSVVQPERKREPPPPPPRQTPVGYLSTDTAQMKPFPTPLQEASPAPASAPAPASPSAPEVPAVPEPSLNATQASDAKAPAAAPSDGTVPVARDAATTKTTAEPSDAAVPEAPAASGE